MFQVLQMTERIPQEHYCCHNSVLVVSAQSFEGPETSSRTYRIEDVSLHLAEYHETPFGEAPTLISTSVPFSSRTDTEFPLRLVTQILPSGDTATPWGARPTFSKIVETSRLEMSSL